MVGIILRFTGNVKNTIKMFLNKIDMSEKVIDIQYWESYGYSTCKYDINKFGELDLSSETITQELIVDDNTIFPEFAELFIRNANCSQSEITTYSSFVNSKYDISIVIIDYRIVEICSKSEKYLVQIVENFKNSSLKNKEIKILNNINQSALLKAWRCNTDMGIGD